MIQTKTVLNTKGIKCQGCVAVAKSAVEKLPGVKEIEFDLPGMTVTVTHDKDSDRSDIARALTKAGFPSE